MTAQLVLLGLGLGLILAIVFYRTRRNGRSVPSDAGAGAEERAARVNEIGRLRRLGAEPALRIVPTDVGGFSKLGGDPELPPGVAWPLGVKGPRAFVGQIDLATVKSLGGPEWLWGSGRIYVFYDPERHGFGDVLRIIYSSEEPGGDVRPPEGGKLRFPACAVGFEPMESLPSLDWLGADYRDFDEEIEDEEDLGAEHQLGGYPIEIQQEQLALTAEHLARGLPEPKDGQEIEADLLAASLDWRLLLQIDSDPRTRMNWGDTGRLFVLVRKEDARRGDFSQTVGFWQTH
jgi:uncharacterized protein YwqG